MTTDDKTPEPPKPLRERCHALLDALREDELADVEACICDILAERIAASLRDNGVSLSCMDWPHEVQP